jgi:hypothetical protein
MRYEAAIQKIFLALFSVANDNFRYIIRFRKKTLPDQA